VTRADVVGGSFELVFPTSQENDVHAFGCQSAGIALPMPRLPPEITATRPFSPSSIAKVVAPGMQRFEIHNH